MLRRGLFLFFLACSLASSEVAVAQNKNAERAAAQKKFEESKQRVDALIAADRKKHGFPPEEDFVGTLEHCNKLSKEWLEKVDRCVADQLKRLIGNRTESAETIADAVMGGCRGSVYVPPPGAASYCMSKDGVRGVIDEFVKSRRQLVITAIVRHRTELSPAKETQSFAIGRSFTGTDLYRACRDTKTPTLETICFFFIRGYLSGLDTGIAITSEPNSRQWFCRRDDLTVEQARSVVEKYLGDNPEELHETANLLVSKALLVAFPCGKPN